jgi:hypothetical protein
MVTLARHAKAQKYTPQAIRIEKSAPNAGKYFKTFPAARLVFRFHYERRSFCYLFYHFLPITQSILWRENSSAAEWQRIT